MINASFNKTDQEVFLYLRARGPAIVQRLVRAITIEDVQLQRHIVLDKLAGQVLHRRTGKLASSVRSLPVVNEGALLIGRVQGGGGPAWYGRVHEWGGSFLAFRHSTARFGRGITGSGRVGRRTRALEERRMPTAYTITFPEKSFMRSALVDRRPTIETNLQAAVKEGKK